MKNNLPRHLAFKTLIKHRHYSLNNYTDLKCIIESKQFAVIEYKKYANSKPVSELIERLHIENEIEQNNSFLYINNNLKFVFINADVSDEDKCSLLRHELGHICDFRLQNSDESYSKVQKEEFANEFSFYAKNPGIPFIIRAFLIRKWKLLVTVIALVACILGCSLVINTFISPSKKPVGGESSSYAASDIYYVTSSGKRYHRKNCIIIKHKNNLTQVELQNAINDGFTPCMICSPQE